MTSPVHEIDRANEAGLAIRVNARGAVIGGFAVIGVAVAGFGGWAATAPLATAVIAPAVVSVDGHRKQVQHLEGGIVRDLLVEDGALVTKDQVLVRLDDTRAKATLGISKSALDAARVLEARLVAERSLTELRFPEALMARAGEANVAEMMRAQSALFAARRASIEGQRAILRQRIIRFEQEILGLEAQLSARETQSALIEEELGGQRELLKTGLTQRSRVLALEREAARIKGERGERISDVARSRNAIGGTELDLLQLDRTFHEKVTGDLRDAQAQIADLRERVGAAEQVLAYIDIRAPASGTAVGLSAHTVGGVIKPGETILEIVPEDSRLMVEAQLNPADIDNVAIGQESEIRLTGLRQRATPVLVGKVAYVSADRLTDPRSGAPYFVTRIDLPPGERARLGGVLVQPGMPAEVMIRQRERTVLDYLLQPVTDAMARAWRED
jgi:HlyD family secretion protein/epimerase transport system membrane fusion protein